LDVKIPLVVGNQEGKFLGSQERRRIHCGCPPATA
jgi:hypothetical protein